MNFIVNQYIFQIRVILYNLKAWFTLNAHGHSHIGADEVSNASSLLLCKYI